MTFWAGIQSQGEMDKQFVKNTMLYTMEQKNTQSVTFTELFNELSKTSVNIITPLFTESSLRDVLRNMSHDPNYLALLDRINIEQLPT